MFFDYLCPKCATMIERIQKGLIAHLIGGEKAIIIYGARQVGKSTLLHDLFGKLDRVLWLNGDDIDVQHLFDNISSTRLKALIGQNKYVVIDEAQRIPSPGTLLHYKSLVNQ